MKTFFACSLLLLALFLPQCASSQYVQINDTYTAQQLVGVLVDNACAQVSNTTVAGAADPGEGNSFGYFSSGTSGFPFSSGIVLSSGYAASVPGPNTSLLSEGSTGWQGDSDLEAALNVSNTINATVLEFDFIPYTDNISFDYIFASEQYLTSITSQNQCNYTDGFAFLIKEVGTNNAYQNLAVVPGTTIPVKVNTVRGQGVCPSANEAYFGGFNSPEHPINFNGETVVLKAEANVTAGTLYHIKLVIADQGNNLYDSAIFLGAGSFKSTTKLGPDRLIATRNPLCEGESLTLEATNPYATGYQWAKNGIPITGANAGTYTVTSAGVYSVLLQFGGSCTSEGTIRIEYVPLPVAGDHTLLQCDENNDGITAYNLNLANVLFTNPNPNAAVAVSYYTTLAAANLGTDPIANTIAYQNTTPGQVLYARVTNEFGCYAIGTLTLLTSANTVVNPDPLNTCDEDGVMDGFTKFDLTQTTAQILQNLPAGLQLQYFTSYADALAILNPIPIPSNFTNTIAGQQVIYARVYNSSECYGIAQFILNVYSFDGSFENTSFVLCSGTTVTLDAGAGYASYSWNTNPVQHSRTIVVAEAGSYVVTVTNSQGCEASKTITIVASSQATGAALIVDDFKGTKNSITVLPEPAGTYEFSLDGLNYQDSAVFGNLQEGYYTIYIKNDCGVYSDTVYVFDYPKYFTPNGDGFHDRWTIPNLASLPGAKLTIYDRYGKIITAFNRNSPGWDGTYNGKPLPSTDYWFTIELKTGRTIRGHFAMVR